MAGRGPAPAEQRARRNEPERGDWREAPGVGWQHGEVPKPPGKLLAVSREAWGTWFGSWFASYWEPSDVPLMRQAIRLYDATERGTATAADQRELRMLLDTMGVTPKGRQDRRWKPPKVEDESGPADVGEDDPYHGLTVVDGAG